MELNDKECFFCGRTDGLERHHIFNAHNRQHSEEDGLVVWLCHNHHNEPPDGVHYNRQLREYLQAYAQMKYEETHTHEEFMERYGKNYI